MTKTNQYPTPLIEPGDFVRLKEPYRPSMTSTWAEGLQRTVRYHVFNDEVEDGDYYWDEAVDVSLPFFEGSEPEKYPKAMEFTHGVVAEIISRYPADVIAFEEGEMMNATILQYHNEHDSTPVRNFALYLFNPAYGTMYLGGHPTESGKPEFVDFHVAEVVLIHKVSEAWGNELELDLVPAYEEMGIEEPATVDPWGDA